MPKATRPDDRRLGRTPVLIRLLRKVDRVHGDPPWEGMTPCWPFMGGLTGKGYGKLRDDAGQWAYAHRIALAAAIGRPLRPGMLACHRCDRKDCCRPSHLYEGTRADNEEDRWYAMREPRGDRIYGVDAVLEPVADWPRPPGRDAEPVLEQAPVHPGVTPEAAWQRSAARVPAG